MEEQTLDHGRGGTALLTPNWCKQKKKTKTENRTKTLGAKAKQIRIEFQSGG